MSSHQPFREVSTKPRKRYARRQQAKARTGAIGYIGGAALFGGVLGLASIAGTPGVIDNLTNKAEAVAVSLDLMRARAPQPGDYWSGCNAARAAGTAPIYIGEPGYREGMDGDGDGIACEPYHGA